MPENHTAAYDKLGDSLRLVFEMASRTEERVKFLVEHDSKTEVKMDKLFALLSELSASALLARNDITELESLRSRVESLERNMVTISVFKATTENKIDTYVGYFWKFMVSMASAAAVYHFGFK